MPQYEISVPGQGTFRVDSPTELTDQQAWQAVQNQLNAPQPTTGAFAAGVKSYLPQVQETYGGLKTLLGVGAERMLGEGQISRGLIESGAASMKEAEAKRQPFMTAERASFTDALDKGVGAVLTEWLPYQAGSGAMQLLESLGLMGAGAVAGSALPGPGTIAGAGTGLVARELAKKGVKEAAEKILKERGEDAAKAYFENEAKQAARKIGATAAIGSQAAFYGTGQTTSRAVEEAQKLGGTATDIELARVLPAAAVSTVAEFIGDKIALGALKGIKPGEAGKYAPIDLAKNILLNIGLTGTKEVPVEVIQSVAERYGAKLSLTDAQALKEYIDATAASYGMAVAPGVGGGVRQTMAERTRPVTPEAQPVTPETTTPASQPPVAPPVAPAPEVAPAAPVAETPVTPVAETPVTPTVETPVAGAQPTILSAPAVEAPATPTVKAPEPAAVDPVGTITALRERLNQPAAPAAAPTPPVEPVVEAAAPVVEEKPKREPSTRKEAEAFGKAIGAAQPYPGELRGRVNLPAQKAAKEGNFQGVLSALEKSKNVIVVEIAKRARALGTKIVIDDNAEETYTGPSTLMRQMSIDGAKMHLEALNKIRALAPQIDALPDGFRLGYGITGEKINAIDQGKDAGRMSLEEIADMGHSMFAPLATGPFKLKTKEDFKRLQKAYEDLTSEYGENALQLTSTGSAEMRGVAGAYDADTDTIRVPEYTAKREEVLSHEIVHAQTVQSIANPTLRQKPIVARLNKLYAHVKKELENRPGRAPYGIQSIQEFVAEGMGNPAFQFLLKKIKYENTSAWDSFVQTIANLIGVKRDTAFTELLSIYSDLTTEQKTAPKAPAVKAPAPKAAAPAAPAAETAAPKAEAPAAPAAPKQPAFVYRTGGGDQTKMQMFTEDETVEFNNVSGQPQIVIIGKNIAGTGEDSIVVYHNNVDRRSNAYDAKDLQKVLDVDPTMVKAIQKWLASDASTITSNGQELAKTLSNFVEGATPSGEKKSLGGERAQVQAFEQTLRSLLNKFGLKDVGLKILDGMTDSGSYAAQIIRIAADAANPVRTLRHEAIHALRELGFFTDAQWSSLSKMAKDKWIDQYLKQRNVDGKPLKAGEESRYDAYMREYKGDMEKITEEAVSDAFADFDATKPPAGMLQALLKRMKDLFQSIKSALTKVESPEQIFGKVEKGELNAGAREAKGEAKSLRDRATANFKRWFGDSMATRDFFFEDGDKSPMLLYHGSRYGSFDKFKPSLHDETGLRGIALTPFVDTAKRYANNEERMLPGDKQIKPYVFAVYVSSPKIPKLSDFYRAVEAHYGVESILDVKEEDIQQYAKANGIRAVDTSEAGERGEIFVLNPNAIKSATENNGEYSLTNADIRKSIGGRNPGEQAISIVNSLGMGVKPPEPGRAQKAMKMLKDAGENPSLTKESAKKTLTKWLDWFETTVFSSDSAFNNKIRRGIIGDFKQNPEVLGMLLEASQSQTVHADALASQFMIDGGLQYNEELKKWESVKKEDNFVALAKKIEDLAKKYNVTKDEMERIAHTYFVAKRLPGIIKRNEELDAEIKAERATAKPDRKQIEEWESLKVKVTDEQLAMMEPGLSLVKTIPELKEVVDIWQGIRKNNIEVMVNSGLWSPEYANAMWDNIDYVPYYREEQLEEGAGPQEFIRGLQVKSKEFKLKGSSAPVNDVFDNMIRWSQYAMNRAIRAHKATQMIDAALKIEVDGKPMATKVTEQKRGMNIVRAFRDGKQELYDMADPLFVPAFSSIQNVSIPTLTFMSKVSNVLRQSVVLYPLFSVAQVPQDSFAAMFSSGLKTQHALKIPYLAVKEFIKTLSKTSATHNELTKYGVVGVRDFSATIIRNDAEIYAGLKPPKGGWGKTKEFLEHIAMAADNAVRQAVYEASMQQGLNKSEALEKAFEIINFRRRGTSKMLNVMGQTVPFFYAYLSAQRVAYRVLSGVGISPTERKEALTTLATTSAAVAALSMLYAMANGDDEDYAETPAAIRDRTLTIPGSGGVRIPLRPDFFLFPKIVAEHTYLMLSDKGFEDGAKFRKSMADALLSAVASPTPFPTAIKPAIEVAINYDFFQGKPLIGNFEKQKDVERQFRDSTSELAKLFGQTGLISPIAADHMIRGMFGSFGGLVLFGTNQFLYSDPDVPRPELSAKEMLAALPGTSGLLKRPQESALKNDFYVLRDEVEKAANTFSDIKNRSPEGIQAFLEDEKNMARLGLAKGVDKINRELSKIRKVMTQITNMPESQMSADEKSENIRQLRELEREILRSVNVKELREMAKI